MLKKYLIKWTTPSIEIKDRLSKAKAILDHLKTVVMFKVVGNNSKDKDMIMNMIKSLKTIINKKVLLIVIKLTEIAGIIADTTPVNIAVTSTKITAMTITIIAVREHNINLSTSTRR